MIDIIKSFTPAKKILAFIVLAIAIYFITVLVMFILGLIFKFTLDNIWLTSMYVPIGAILLLDQWIFLSKKKQE